MAERKFLDFLDRIDGGGAGQSGDQFEGGGLLSLLGNLAAGITPYGSEDERRAAARAKFYEGQSGMDAPMPTTAGGMAPTAASLATTGASLAQMPSPDNFYNNPNQTRAVPGTFYNNPNQVAPAPAPTPAAMPNNSGMTPANAYVPPQQYSASGMNPANVYDGNQERFARQLVEMIGPDAAQSLMSSGMGEQAYQAFVANGYNMPNY